MKSMVEFRGVSKAFRNREGAKRILARTDLVIPRGRSIGVLGLNGAGKSTLLRMIAGTEPPDTGTIRRNVRMSWPLGFSGGFNGSLSGVENLRFICRIYGADIGRVAAFVEDFAELGSYLRMPVRTYSSGMKGRLAFALSMAIDFECYLVDEIIGVGDRRFQKKCREAFQERKARSDLIMVSHSMSIIREHCEVAAILSGGCLTLYDDMDEAVALYEELAA